MTGINAIAGLVVVFIGLAFMFIGSLGIVRLPDFFTRTHAAGKADTVGITIVLTGIAVMEGFTLSSAKVLLAATFVIMTNPVATHALARAALRKGQKPWKRPSKAPCPVEK